VVTGLLLVKAADVFKQRHGGSLPSTPQMREEFKNIIRSWMRSVDGCPIPEENFEEALSNVSKVWGPRKLRTYPIICPYNCHVLVQQ